MIAGRRLPERELLRLQEATTFAFYGVGFSRRTHSLEELSKLDKKLSDLSYPSIYRTIDTSNSAELTRAHIGFDFALSDAGLAGAVKFYAVESETEREVPKSYFINPRGFSTQDDRIEATYYWAPIEAMLDEDRGEPIRDVLVGRSGFLLWLMKAYPYIPFSLSTDCSDYASATIANSADVPPKRPSSRSKRGRKPYSFWQAVKPLVMEKLDADGLPNAQSGEQGWTHQADLERYIADRIAVRLAPEQTPPTESRVRDYAAEWLNEFIGSRTAEGR